MTDTSSSPARSFQCFNRGRREQRGLDALQPDGYQSSRLGPSNSGFVRTFPDRALRLFARARRKRGGSRNPYSIEGLGRDALAIMDALRHRKSPLAWVFRWRKHRRTMAPRPCARAHRPGGVLASTAAQIPGPDLWNSRIRSARDTSGMNGVCHGGRRALVHQRLSAMPIRKKRGSRDGDGQDVRRCTAIWPPWPPSATYGYARSHSKHKQQGSGHHARGGTIHQRRQGWAPWSPVPSKAPNSSRWKPRICRISRMKRISPRRRSIS